MIGDIDSNAGMICTLEEFFEWVEEHYKGNQPRIIMEQYRDGLIRVKRGYNRHN